MFLKSRSSENRPSGALTAIEDGCCRYILVYHSKIGVSSRMQVVRSFVVVCGHFVVHVRHHTDHPS